MTYFSSKRLKNFNRSVGKLPSLNKKPSKYTNGNLASTGDLLLFDGNKFGNFTKSRTENSVHLKSQFGNSKNKNTNKTIRGH